MKFLLLSLLAGLSSALGFEPLGLWPLTLAAFAALIWLVGTAPRLRTALARGWWFGVGNFVVGLNWIATAFTYQAAMPAWLGWIAVVLLSLYLAVYPAMAAGLAWRWGRTPTRHPRESGDPASSSSSAGAADTSADEQEKQRNSRFRGNDGVILTLVFAAAWIVTEWLRATMFTGFAWNPVGVALLPTPIAKASTLVGTYGLSGIAVLLSGVLLLLAYRHWRSAAAVAVAVAGFAGLAHLIHSPVDTRPGMALRIVQPNIGQEVKWNPEFEIENFRRLRRMTRGGTGEPRLVLWPEAAVTDPLEDGRVDPYVQRGLIRTRLLVGASIEPNDLLLTGGVKLRSIDGMRATSGTNAVFVMNHAGRILARYDKAHLVPYGEYLPMRPLLSTLGLSRLAPGDIDFDSGPGPQSFLLPGVGQIGFQLCYEIIFSGEVVQRGNRPEFLFNPSNDAWFGAWGPPQHLAQARMRAVEEGLPVLRSTPTGISAVIDSEGRLLHSIPWRTSGVIDARLPRPAPETLFSKFGNVLPILFALLLAGIAIAVRVKSRYGRT
jgi:apolipoprotein N-acyltransferase